MLCVLSCVLCRAGCSVFRAELCCVVHFDKMYDGNSSFDIILHHGGFFTVKDKLRVYLGGQECFLKKNDPDKWSVFELHDNCKELDVCNVIQFYYCTPGINLNDGLNYLRTDDDTRRFLEYAFIAPKNVIHVYVEHEEVAPLDMISGLVPMLECNQVEGNEDDVDDVDDRDKDEDECLDKETTSEILKYFEEFQPCGASFQVQLFIANQKAVVHAAYIVSFSNILYAGDLFL